ncbi:DUF4360 domain-containing protein [Lentzea sp. NPDC051213]|uniref:DUF4360 domain-containing protein n=1 Tax=Lentzea sp. NPDC051213 TaxID=3364126 RepID=UPI0037A8735B
MRIGTVAVCTVLGLATTSVAHADPPPADQVFIQSVTYAGSGCPAGSVAAALQDDRTSMRMAFDKFVASVGPDVQFSESRKNCNVVVKLRMPQGWHVAVPMIDYEGYIDLQQKVTARIRTAVYTPRTADRTTTFGSDWTGPIVSSFSVRDTVSAEGVVFSANPGDTVLLHVNTQMHVDNAANKNGSGLLTVDEIDHKTKLVLGLQWRHD